MSSSFVEYIYKGKQCKIRYSDFAFLNVLWEKVEKKIIPESIFDGFVKGINLENPKKPVEDGFMNYFSQTQGIKAKPLAESKTSVDLGYLVTKFPSVSVEQEFRLLKNDGKIIHNPNEHKKYHEKINKAISKVFDASYIGSIFEDNVLRMAENLSSFIGSKKSLERLSASVQEKRKAVGQKLMDKFLLFVDPEIEVIEIRSPPCYDPESLRDFLDLSRQAIDEVKGDNIIVPSCILQNNNYYTANVNVHIGIPSLQTISEMGFEIDIKKFTQIPLVMANALRDVYFLISGASRNSFNNDTRMLWFDKFMQVRAYYRKEKKNDFMIGKKFTWKDYERQISSDFRPNIGIRNYGTVEINMDPQSSVDEIVSDAFSFASVAFLSVMEYLRTGKTTSRDFSSDSLELHVLKTELAGAVDEKELSAVLPAPSLKKLLKDKKTRTFINSLFSSENTGIADSFLESLINQGFLEKVPAQDFRKEIIARSLDTELVFNTKDFEKIMMPEKQECGSNTQKKIEDPVEILNKSSENFFHKNKKWRTS